MAHEITRNDGLVLTARSAWHGLGTLVESAPTPAEALKLAGLDWEVKARNLRVNHPADDNGPADIGNVSTHAALVRQDTRDVLGIVGEGYRPIQNAELADFAGALATGTDTVKIETAGSIRGGQRVWMLLRGESFSVRRGDEIKPYILISNGHDGNTAFRATATSVRVVCSNTLHLVIPQADAIGRRGFKTAGFAIRHNGDVMAKVEEARKVIGLYQQARSESEGAMKALAAHDVKSEEVQAFFLEAYSRDFGAIAASPSTEKEKDHRENALEAFAEFGKRFDREAAIAGTTAWNTFNAYTGWLQHDRPVRAREEYRAEARVNQNLFGSGVERAGDTFRQALAMI